MAVDPTPQTATAAPPAAPSALPTAEAPAANSLPNIVTPLADHLPAVKTQLPQATPGVTGPTAPLPKKVVPSVNGAPAVVTPSQRASVSTAATNNATGPLPIVNVPAADHPMTPQRAPESTAQPAKPQSRPTATTAGFLPDTPPLGATLATPLAMQGAPVPAVIPGAAATAPAPAQQGAAQIPTAAPANPPPQQQAQAPSPTVVRPTARSKLAATADAPFVAALDPHIVPAHPVATRSAQATPAPKGATVPSTVTAQANATTTALPPLVAPLDAHVVPAQPGSRASATRAAENQLVPSAAGPAAQPQATNITLNISPEVRHTQSENLANMMKIKNPQTRQSFMQTMNNMPPASFAAFNETMMAKYAPVQNATGTLGVQAQNKAFGAAMDAAYHAAPNPAAGRGVANSLSHVKSQIDSDRKGPQTVVAGPSAGNANNKNAESNHDGGGVGSNGRQHTNSTQDAPKPGAKKDDQAKPGEPKTVQDVVNTSRGTHNGKTGVVVEQIRYDAITGQPIKNAFMALDQLPEEKVNAHGNGLKTNPGDHVANNQSPQAPKGANHPHYAALTQAGYGNSGATAMASAANTFKHAGTKGDLQSTAYGQMIKLG